LKDRYEKGFTEEDLDEYIAHVNDYLEFHLNKDFTPRIIVGDNPYDLSDRGYGNPDVKGPDSRHGTGVASVIAANRGEGIGIDGIADLVEIMVIRSTPNGDERDKDVALAIMYAVDNGARIINMSFGKDFSPQKEFVDQAVKYAEEKGVLLVHAAGNDGANIDIVGNFPSATYSNNIKASNWIEVGANAKFADKELATSFSNYGGNNVDIFAPGHDIIAADTSNTYSTNSGTSLAAPVVTGVAALLMSAYPDLSPQEIKDILMVSSHQPKKPRKVYLPGDNEKKQKVKFKELSQSGGIINAYEAMVEAERRQRVTEQSK
jgi:subtilisin family serine protease